MFYLCRPELLYRMGFGTIVKCTTQLQFDVLYIFHKSHSFFTHVCFIFEIWCEMKDGVWVHTDAYWCILRTRYSVLGTRCQELSTRYQVQLYMQILYKVPSTTVQANLRSLRECIFSCSTCMPSLSQLGSSMPLSVSLYIYICIYVYRYACI